MGIVKLIQTVVKHNKQGDRNELIHDSSQIWTVTRRERTELSPVSAEMRERLGSGLFLFIYMLLVLLLLLSFFSDTFSSLTIIEIHFLVDAL